MVAPMLTPPTLRRYRFPLKRSVPLPLPKPRMKPARTSRNSTRPVPASAGRTGRAVKAKGAAAMPAMAFTRRRRVVLAGAEVGRALETICLASWLNSPNAD